MRGMKRHLVIALLSLVVLCAGCSSSAASMPPAPSAPSSPEAATTESPPATPALPTTSTPRPTASPRPCQTASGVRVDTVAVTLVDGLRVRSKPSVSDDSPVRAAAARRDPAVRPRWSGLGLRLYVVRDRPARFRQPSAGLGRRSRPIERTLACARVTSHVPPSRQTSDPSRLSRRPSGWRASRGLRSPSPLV